LKAIKIEKVKNRSFMNEVEKRAEKNFLEYAGAVIKARAISNIEDNLKPVHKRVLWTYYNRKVFDDAKTQKCATLAGAVLAYHPHG
jgi:DNA gyrase subunit A